MDGKTQNPGLRNSIFISFVNDDKGNIKQIEDRLSELRYSLLPSKEQPRENRHLTVATEVKSSAVVLLCLCPEYKKDLLCRMEANLAYAGKKVVIPLLMEKGWEPDGWLGELVGERTILDFSIQNIFEEKFTDLHERIKAEINTPEENQAIQSSGDGEALNEDKVFKWLNENPDSFRKYLEIAEECRISKAKNNKGHVMISYDWSQQDKAKWISEKLKENGYKIWIDIDDMGEELTPSMTKAIKDAHVVLVCMSSRYETRINCLKEAHYAELKQKIVIPLKMEKGSIPDLWLGFFFAGKKYYDFSNEDEKDKKMFDLLKALDKCYADILEDNQMKPFVSYNP